MELRALLWDVDGTLAETEELHRRAFNLAFAEAGLSFHWDRRTYAGLLRVTGGMERIERFRKSRGGNGRDASPGPFPPSAALHERKTEIYGRLLAEGGLAPRPGVVRLIGQARKAGLAQAICTTTSRPNVERVLRACPGLDAAAFAVTVCGGDVRAKKPDPEAYRLVLARLGLPGRACLALEDSRNGLEAAFGAGIATVIAPSEFTAGENFTGALAVADGLESLTLETLRELFRSVPVA